MFKVTKESFVESWKFMVPSVFYAINNNIYFVGISYVPPPIWIILCSARTALTAIIYKVFQYYFEAILSVSNTGPTVP